MVKSVRMQRFLLAMWDVVAWCIATLALAAARYDFTLSAVQWRAALLYPDSTYLQAEWQRAVAVVRATSGGWLLDKPQRRAGHA